jgi:hypothetical protein
MAIASLVAGILGLSLLPAVSSIIALGHGTTRRPKGRDWQQPASLSWGGGVLVLLVGA